MSKPIVAKSGSEPGQKAGGAKRQEREAKKAARDAKTADRSALEQAAGQSSKRTETVARLEALAAGIAEPAGLEIVEIEWKGSGRNQLLRISIDKPEGVTHADCELVSHGMSAILDAEDPISGTYELEVSSPGVERKLSKRADWQRFTGQKVKVVLKEPVDEMKFFDGTISRVEITGRNSQVTATAGADGNITVNLADGREVTFAFSQVDRANLKFEW